MSGLKQVTFEIYGKTRIVRDIREYDGLDHLWCFYLGIIYFTPLLKSAKIFL